jgi:hypothetical protein
MTGDSASVSSPIILPWRELGHLAGVPVNPMVSIIALRDAGEPDIRYYVADERHPRLDITLDMIRHLRAIALHEGMAVPETERVVIQGDDTPVDVESVSWGTQVNWSAIRLIPDLYYFFAQGYEDFEPDLEAWDERPASIVWRGSTTGRFGQTVENVQDLPRYRLCKLALELGSRADVGITDVVQSHPEHTDLIRERLQNEGIFRDFVPFAEMGRHRFIMDMDGNSSSWNFMMKLRLGCCVLRVESPWRQWFSSRLIAWKHYVPVAADLSDFLARADWCFAHPAESAAIAAAGKQFAVDMKFSVELSNAARATFAPGSLGDSDEI